MTHPDEGTAKPGWRQAIGVAGVAVVLKRFSDAELDSDEPQAVLSTKEISALARRAMELAAQDSIDDATAIKDLQNLARRRQKRLFRAAASIRMGNYREHRTSIRANRLLLAAAGRPVTPLTVEEEQLLDEIEHLLSLPRDEGFALLAQREPQLRTVEDRLPISDAERPLSIDEEDVALEEIVEALAPLVGPASGASDPLLRTANAHGVARIHLSLRAGVTLTDDDPTEPPLDRLARGYGVRPNPREISDAILGCLGLPKDDKTKNAILVIVVAITHSFPETLDRLEAGDGTSRRFRRFATEATSHLVHSPEELLDAVLVDMQRAIGQAD